ncbi:MAG: metallophosphoesterase [Myxococcales bacterium]|nr:metallophosphoesterase [Myxococcales bacterium]MCB9644006.1 metallophosphoesterase [Myxococcales bacterium]
MTSKTDGDAKNNQSNIEQAADMSVATPWTRRAFLAQSALGAAALGLWGVGGCTPPMGSEQVGDGGGKEVDTRPPIALTKGPYLQLMGLNEVRLRFETQSEDGLEVTLHQAAKEVAKQMSQGKLQKIEAAFPADDPSLERRDRPGDYAVHEVRFASLKAGEHYEWRLSRRGGAVEEGSFRAPAAKGQPFRVGWISDTMYPQHEKSVQLLAGKKPDIVWHGGDIQYQTNFLDTWEGVFQVFEPLLRKAPMHFCVGNHEYEGLDEFEIFYTRLLGGHGDQGAANDYHAFTYGGVRFLALNSEEGVDKDDTPQMKWLKDELMKVEQSPDLMYAVVGFHRPYYTFGRSKPPLGMRALLHPLFKQYKVPLVMSGHNHSYERFDIDGIAYVVDGCGGAIGYNPDEYLEEFKANAPDEVAARRAVDRGFGCSLLDFDPKGTLTLTHHEFEGNKEVDRLVIPKA